MGSGNDQSLAQIDAVIGPEVERVDAQGIVAYPSGIKATAAKQNSIVRRTAGIAHEKSASCQIGRRAVVSNRCAILDSVPLPAREPAHATGLRNAHAAADGGRRCASSILAAGDSAPGNRSHAGFRPVMLRLRKAQKRK